jgi:hypothetical protein
MLHNRSKVFEELIMLVLLPFATTQQKDCRKLPAVFI